VPPGPLMLARSGLQLQLGGDWAEQWDDLWTRIRIRCVSRLMLKYEYATVESLSTALHGSRKYFYLNKGE
jgi:hypothetical protein